jgi:ATP-dependent RNA helicase RhlE
MPFATLGLSPFLCSPLSRLGYTRPTPVQVASIPIVLTGTDLLARAQTGTGKTAAFGLPMIHRLLAGGDRLGGVGRPRGLVLVPTRELALQVQQSLSAYGAPMNARVTAIFGGVPIAAQVKSLQRGADIIVATPGRLLDHLARRTVDLSGIEILTLDEADRMLDMGFLPAMRRVLGVLPRHRQTLLFSATLSSDIVKLSAEFTRQPQRVDVSPAETVAPTVTHRVHPVSEGSKGALLTHLLMQSPVGQALVFCKTKRGSNRVGEYLERHGVKVAVIHGNKSQGARTRALAGFKAGRVTVLVATDIAARGLDIVQLPLVVNYDMPLVPSDYVHRIGRTGRAGLAGRAISLVSPADRPLLQEIQRLLPDPIERVVIDGFNVPEESRPVTRPRERDSRSPGPFASRPSGSRTPGSRPSASRRPRRRSHARRFSGEPQTR